MLVLGIETSCDETGLALYHSQDGLIGHILHSQVKLHAEYGGVVPELASRDHIRRLTPLLKSLLASHQLTLADLDGVAYTNGPGLLGALLSGAAFGKSLAWGLNIPSVEVHHMEAHLLAPMLEAEPPELPFVALLVSGGHSMLVKVTRIGEYECLGQSLDDAAGEAFDKTAKLLELGYPGGPAIAKLAETGDPNRFHFPRPMTDRPGLDFSFSGLKTFALNTISNNPSDAKTKADIACAFQDAVVDVMCIKSKRALQATNIKQLIVAGGVGANKKLRAELKKMGAAMGVKVQYPRIEFCTDNGAMVAYTGCIKLLEKPEQNLAIQPKARWPIGSEF